MMTVAAELGIDSCPIEGFNRAKVDKYLADKGIIDPNKFGASVMLVIRSNQRRPGNQWMKYWKSLNSFIDKKRLGFVLKSNLFYYQVIFEPF